MRILVATDQWFPDRMGGVARVATDTSRGWAARGHEVVVIAPRHEGAPDKTYDDGLTLLRVLPRGRLPQTVTDPIATRRHASQLLDRDFDVLVAHGCTTATGLLAARLARPLVFVFHADAAREARYLRAALRPGAEWLAAVLLEGTLRRLTRRAVTEAATVVVLSEFSRTLVSDVASAAGRHAALVAGAVDTTKFSPAGRDEARAKLGVQPSTNLVLTVRRLEPRMGLENLLEATALLDDVPDLRVVVAGSGRGLQLEALRARLGLGRVDLIGRVSDAELPLWYRAADLFVLPTVAYEGFGLATAEALASGTPVVGTPVGATPELLMALERRLLARSSEPADLADAIRVGLRLAGPELRARCRDHALAHLSWEVALPKWESVLEETVQLDHAHRETADRVGLRTVEDR